MKITTHTGNEGYSFEFLTKLREKGTSLQGILKQDADKAMQTLVELAIALDPVVDPNPMEVEDYLKGMVSLCFELSKKEGFYREFTDTTHNLDEETLTRNAAFLLYRG